MTTDTDIPETPPERRPLGLTLRAAGSLLARELDAALEPLHVDRRDAMLLAALADPDGASPLSGLPGRSPSRPGPASHRGGRLADRGWIAFVDDEWTPTDEGRAAHDRIAAAVAGVHERVAEAVSPEALATTVASLEAIVRALGDEDRPPLLNHGHHDHGPRHGGPRHGVRDDSEGLHHDAPHAHECDDRGHRDHGAPHDHRHHHGGRHDRARHHRAPHPHDRHDHGPHRDGRPHPRHPFGRPHHPFGRPHHPFGRPHHPFGRPHRAF